RHDLRRHPVESPVRAARQAGPAEGGRIRRAACRRPPGTRTSAGIRRVTVIYFPLALLVSLLASLALCAAVRRGAPAIGAVVPPRPDRWHSEPTPTMGGVAIAVATVLGFALMVPNVNLGVMP